MTHMNTTLPGTNSLPAADAGSFFGWMRRGARPLVLVLKALGRSMAAVAKAIGMAASMAYVDPYMPQGKDRK